MEFREVSSSPNSSLSPRSQPSVLTLYLGPPNKVKGSSCDMESAVASLYDGGWEGAGGAAKPQSCILSVN